MEKINVAVTGISGYFGQMLLPLLEQDEQVRAVFGFDQKPFPPARGPGVATMISQSQSVPRKLVFHQMDIRDPGLESLIKGCDVLVHLAFQVMRLPGNLASANIDEINIKGFRKVCEISARQGVKKLVITSSVVAYGLHADNPAILTEDSPLRPNPGLYYSMAKASNEYFLDDFQQRHPEMIITRLRPCTVAGPQADPAMMASLVSNPTILVRGYNPPIQILHEEDLAQALYLAICQDLQGVYNVTSNEARTLTELVSLRGGRILALPLFLAKFLMAVAWRFGKSAFAPEWIDLSRFSIVASNAKLIAAGWKPKYTTSQTFLDLLSGAKGNRYERK